jgi:hypothetical protein
MSWRNFRGWQGILHVSVWSALLGTFLFQSAPIVGHAVAENNIGSIDANHTLDNYLQTLTGLRNGSQRVDEVLQSLPKNRPLVIFVRGDNPPSDFLGMLVGYLSWPRDVRIVKLRNTTVDQEVAAIAPSSVAALVFCSVSPPPSLGKAIRLGSNILLVPVPEANP